MVRCDRAIANLPGPICTMFYAGLAALFLLSIIATYEGGRRFARELGAGPCLSAGAAAVYLFGTGALLTDGMESVLAVPLFLWLLAEVARPISVTARRAAKLGFLASLVILSRLDLAIAVAFLVGGSVIAMRRTPRHLLVALAAFCLAGFLVPLYAIANLIFFDALLPVSAQAKRLVMTPGFDFCTPFVWRAERCSAKRWGSSYHSARSHSAFSCGAGRIRGRQHDLQAVSQCFLRSRSSV